MKAFQISALEAIVENFYRKIKVDTNSAIAYKGGHYERDLLASLNIPSINLECFQCPKAEGLFDQLVWLETCGHHLTNDAALPKSRGRGLRGMVAATAPRERQKNPVSFKNQQILKKIKRFELHEYVSLLHCCILTHFVIALFSFLLALKRAGFFFKFFFS